ncbi:MAG: winged helix-turn-helix domain-containing protein [candidate division WOR-3 bacterium]
MAKTTFWDVIEKTIEKVGTPLSAKEIWDKAIELGTLGDFSTTGKTPWATTAAYCYTDINKNGEDSLIIQTSERPAQFFLRRLASQLDLQKVQKKQEIELANKEKIAPESLVKEIYIHC